jgi:hypothetical protein
MKLEDKGRDEQTKIESMTIGKEQNTIGLNSSRIWIGQSVNLSLEPVQLNYFRSIFHFFSATLVSIVLAFV